MSCGKRRMMPDTATSSGLSDPVMTSDTEIIDLAVNR